MMSNHSCYVFNITILLSIPTDTEEPEEIVEVIDTVEVEVPDIQNDVVETVSPVAGDAGKVIVTG